MYKRETKAVGRIFEKAMLKKFSNLLTSPPIMLNSIRYATPPRSVKTPLLKLWNKKSGKEDIEFILVVGGFDSSNTSHLKEIPHLNGVKSYHIDRAERITADNTIMHRTVERHCDKGLLTEG